jgi:crotonobetainyl-CoA:carnitine CoA-transferase CaiB-like acyl-CoA transferase
VKICDLSQGVAGPYCGLLLAQQGAEVVKIEPPGGDWLQHLGVQAHGQGPHYWYLNRGKQRRTLDLRSSDGRQAAIELAMQSDVLLASFRPGVLERMGLGAQAMLAARPELVHCTISGFGTTGPMASRPAVDGVIQALGGWMTINRTAQGHPRPLAYFPIDMLAGMYAFQTVLAALIRRWRSGSGSAHDVGLLHAAAAFLGPRLFEHACEQGRPRDLFSSPNGAYRTRDGWYMVAVTTQAQFEQVCEALSCPEIARDPRFASRQLRIDHRAALDELVAARMTLLDSAECDRAFAAAGAMGAPVLDLQGVLDHPQLAAIGGFEHLDTAWGKGLPVATTPGADIIS